MGSVEVFVATGDPLAAAIFELAESHQNGWRGSAQDLHGRLSAIVDGATRRSAAWPASASVLVWRIKLLRPALRRFGILIERKRGDNKFICILSAAQSAARKARRRRMGLFSLTAAEAKALVDSCRTLSPLRATIDALRRNPGAFAVVPSAAHVSWADVPRGFGRLTAADVVRSDFPLRQIFKAHGSPYVDGGRFVGEVDAKPYDAAAFRQDLAQRRGENLDGALSAAAWLAGAAGDLVAAAPPGDGRLDELATQLGWAVIAILRAGAGRPAEPSATAEADKLVPIATAAQILGVSKNAALKRARQKGFVELVGKRVHIRRGLIDRLYPMRATLA